ncbi:nucleoside-diphosphate kinase [Haloglycomyces albus]|uniref:nucleoside-diphosphate kinase n=1 Tax=Haloglycomyces albus TaxID=526067 RepID=UPI0012EB1CC1|nr:nucleoside-diphosphate kinase [Haloglycomyces albus]
MAEQSTLILIKPDAVERGLIGTVLNRLENKGLTIEKMEMRTMTSELADAHYAEHVEKPFYPDLKAFMTSRPLVALIATGDEAIPAVRTIAGATDGRKAEAGTIRGDYSLSQQRNLIHASDSPESAKREIDLWFN